MSTSGGENVTKAMFEQLLKWLAVINEKEDTEK